MAERQSTRDQLPDIAPEPAQARPRSRSWVGHAVFGAVAVAGFGLVIALTVLFSDDAHDAAALDPPSVPIATSSPLGSFVITLYDVSYPKGSRDYYPGPGMKFIAVELVLYNATDDTAFVAPLAQFWFEDGAGRRYDIFGFGVEESHAPYVGYGSDSGPAFPIQPETGVRIVFDTAIDEDAPDLRLRFLPDPLQDEGTVDVLIP
jgi:hypothetical protein